jgi:hypothetical protein
MEDGLEKEKNKDQRPVRLMFRNVNSQYGLSGFNLWSPCP